MKRILKLLFAAVALVCLAPSAVAQFTTVSASSVGGTGHLVASGMIFWQPVTGFRIGSSSGQALGTPYSAAVTTGAFSLSVPDASLSSPTYPCYSVTVIDNLTGNVLLGAGLAADGIHVNTGGAYGCVQPSGSTWSFDSYVPAAPAGTMEVSGPPGATGVINWRGAWAATTAYAKNDGYVESSSGYIVIAAYTSGSTFGSADTTNSVEVAIPAIGTTPAINEWTSNLANQLLVFDGASIDWGDCDLSTYGGGCTSSATQSNGGSAGAFGLAISQSPWCVNGCTYYNHALPGEGSVNGYAGYTGSTTYGGVTVSSPHSLSPAVTGSPNRAFYFVGMDNVINDCISAVPTSTSLSDYESWTAAAHADGYFVVLITPTTGTYPGYSACPAQLQTLRQDALDGLIYSDMVVDAWNWMPDITDAILYGTVVHPTAQGYKRLAQNLVTCLRNDGCPATYTGNYLVGSAGIYTYLSPGNPVMLFSENGSATGFPVIGSAAVGGSPSISGVASSLFGIANSGTAWLLAFDLSGNMGIAGAMHASGFQGATGGFNAAYNGALSGGPCGEEDSPSVLCAPTADTNTSATRVGAFQTDEASGPFGLFVSITGASTAAARITDLQTGQDQVSNGGILRLQNTAGIVEVPSVPVSNNDQEPASTAAVTTALSSVPTVGTPTLNQALCVKAVGPPVLIGYCSTVVSSGGGCTCN